MNKFLALALLFVVVEGEAFNNPPPRETPPPQISMITLGNVTERDCGTNNEKDICRVVTSDGRTFIAHLTYTNVTLYQPVNLVLMMNPMQSRFLCGMGSGPCAKIIEYIM